MHKTHKDTELITAVVDESMRVRTNTQYAVASIMATRTLPKVASRLIDVIFSIMILVFLSPLMLLVAVIIKLDSEGPAFFRQTRVGQNQRSMERRGKSSRAKNSLVEIDNRPDKRVNEDRRKENVLGAPFEFYKFRTMYVDAKERFPELYAYQYSAEEIKTIPFKLKDDPRLTRVGVVLRKTSLDELPNFINVVKGNMALVGPRPDIPEMMKYYQDWQRVKFAVKPGVTGLAQISGRGTLCFQETLEKDVEYVRLSQSVRRDMVIILKTIKSIAQRTGAF